MPKLRVLSGREVLTIATNGSESELIRSAPFGRWQGSVQQMQ
jgi:hypothetical protein